MPTRRYVIVDVFTERALAGSQPAVFADARGVDSETMQALAKEIGFSEMTLVLPGDRVRRSRRESRGRRVRRVQAVALTSERRKAFVTACARV